MNSPERITVGTVELDWDEDTRLATVRFTRESHVTGEDAKVLVEALTRWIGTEGKTFGVLGDGAKLSSADAEYRAVWGTFFKHHRGESFIAFFNMKPTVRIAAEMFRIATGVQLKAFADEDGARSWLRERNISA